MTKNGSESLPFEPPEQENIRLREENARLRRLLAVHSIPIPQLAPENPPPAKPTEPVSPVDKQERARKRIALFRSLFRGREDVTHGDGKTTMAGTDIRGSKAKHGAMPYGPRSGILSARFSPKVSAPQFPT
jgi:hypothetical protein